MNSHTKVISHVDIMVESASITRETWVIRGNRNMYDSVPINLYFIIVSA